MGLLWVLKDKKNTKKNSSNIKLKKNGKFKYINSTWRKIYKNRPWGVQTYIENNQRARKSYISTDVGKNYGLPLDLEEEEDREIRAISGYNYEYKKYKILF